MKNLEVLPEKLTKLQSQDGGTLSQEAPGADEASNQGASEDDKANLNWEDVFEGVDESSFNMAYNFLHVIAADDPEEMMFLL